LADVVDPALTNAPDVAANPANNATSVDLELFDRNDLPPESARRDPRPVGLLRCCIHDTPTAACRSDATGQAIARVHEGAESRLRVRWESRLQKSRVHEQHGIDVAQRGRL
jgi:hypothetical protein